MTLKTRAVNKQTNKQFVFFVHRKLNTLRPPQLPFLCTSGSVSHHWPPVGEWGGCPHWCHHLWWEEARRLVPSLNTLCTPVDSYYHILAVHPHKNTHNTFKMKRCSLDVHGQHEQIYNIYNIQAIYHSSITFSALVKWNGFFLRNYRCIIYYTPVCFVGSVGVHTDSRCHM